MQEKRRVLCTTAKRKTTVKSATAIIWYIKFKLTYKVTARTFLSHLTDNYLITVLNITLKAGEKGRTDNRPPEISFQTRGKNSAVSLQHVSCHKYTSFFPLLPTLMTIMKL
jgi:hypothetical protein